MSKDTIDWNALESALNPKKEAYRVYDAVNGPFRKVAFDMYKDVTDGSLWEMREVDGKKLLFALYDEDGVEKTATASVKSDWSAHPDSSEENVTLIYRNTPIYRFAASEYGFIGDAHKFASYVVNKANKDKDFIAGVLKQVSPARRQHILSVLEGGE